MPISVEARAAATRNSSGFDYLRIGLAVSVVAWHSLPISHGAALTDELKNTPFIVLIALVLPMFFALSGFLVAGSLQRNTIPAFLSLRALRILPALIVEVTLSALVLGPLLTNLSFSEYVSDLQFRQYFLNIIGWIHYTLPGLFGSNPMPHIVNGSLWTIPFELECYVALVLISVIGLFGRRTMLLFGTVAAAAALSATAYTTPNTEIQLIPGRVLVVAFLAGVLVYLWKDKIPYSTRLAAICLLASLALLLSEWTMYLATFPIAYLTVWFGLQNPPRAPVIFSGDYSYGLYLFAFPIQQTIAMVPDLRHWWINLPLAVVGGLLYAAFSWHVIEKPVLGMKNTTVALVNKINSRVKDIAFRRKPAPVK
jgi:peptidoglycan/LPS O-acetylase OafA/YrhL